MEELAGAVPASEIGREAWGLYERFRPEWGGKGVKTELKLQLFRGLASPWRQEG